MTIRKLYLVILASILVVVTGCGGGGAGDGAGYNGSLTLSTVQTGAVITATAKYSPADTITTNLSGLQIYFSTDLSGPIPGTYRTDSTGTAVCAFTPTPFNGQKTITVMAKTGNLTQYSPITMSGRTLTVVPPPNQGPTTVTGNDGDSYPVILTSQNFVTITDPFFNDINNHNITITASFTTAPNNVNDALTLDSQPTIKQGATAISTNNKTGGTGVVALPGTTMSLVIPSTGTTKTATITWTATDTTTGLAGAGSTVVTISR